MIVGSKREFYLRPRRRVFLDSLSRNRCNHVETKVAFRHSKGVTRLRGRAPGPFLPASKPVPPVLPKNRHVFKSTRGVNSVENRVETLVSMGNCC